MEIVDFPDSEKHGGYGPSYMAQLDKHVEYTKAAVADLKAMIRARPATQEPPAFTTDIDKHWIHVEMRLPLTVENREAAIANLVGLATMDGKRIMDVGHGTMDLGDGPRWYCFCELGA